MALSLALSDPWARLLHGQGHGGECQYLELKRVPCCCAEAGELVSRACARGQLSPCIFEYIYLARPDSVLNDIPVYSFQLGLGTRLSQRIRCARARPCFIPALVAIACARAMLTCADAHMAHAHGWPFHRSVMGICLPLT